MKHISCVLRWMLNVVLYGVYVLLASFVFSLLFPLLQSMLGKELWDIQDPRFVKIQLLIAVLVGIFSLILRKYLYISCKKEKIIKENTGYTAQKKEKKIPNEYREEIQKNEQQEEVSDIKILVEKEIK